MAINPINGLSTPDACPGGGQVARVVPARPDQAGASPDQQVAEVDKMDLTPDSLNLLQMKIQSVEAPVDRERVATLRAVIASGQYPVNSIRVASKLIDFETTLFA